MKWSIAKESLEGAIAIVANVPPRNGIKASEFIKVSRAGKDGASFSLTSDVMAKAVVRTGDRFPFKHGLYLDRRMFMPFVDKGKESRSPMYIFIVKKDGSIVVRHGNRRAMYEKAQTINGYENVPDIEGSKTSSLDKRWIELIDAAKQCATDDPISPQFNCVYINPRKTGLEIFSGNGIVVFKGRAPKSKYIKESIAFPLMLVDSLLLENAQKLLWTNKFAMISFPKGKIWQAVKTAARKNFPLEDAHALIASLKKDEVVMKFPASSMARIADRIASYVQALSRESLLLTLKLEKGSKVCSITSGSSASKFEEIIRIAKPAKRDITIEWPLEHVMPILLYCKEDGAMRIHMSKEERTCIVTDTVALVVARPEHKAKKKKKAK